MAPPLNINFWGRCANFIQAFGNFTSSALRENQKRAGLK
jgi:hypothetical protein